MAVIIIEGQDNCGKSTLIRNLIKNNKNPKRIVCSSVSPPAGVNASEWAFMHYSFSLDNAIKLSREGWDVYFDRAHLGEAVYGPLYRETPGDWVFNMESGLNLDNNDDVSLIVLIGTDGHLSKFDDGLSLSTDFFEEERKLFRKAYENSLIKHKDIWVLDKSYYGLYDNVIKFLGVEHVTID